MADNDGTLGAALRSRGITVIPDRGIADRLAFASPETAEAYRELTLAGAPAGLTLYFVDRWLEHVAPVRVAALARLRGIARYQSRPAPTLADLAASITVREDHIRQHLIRWWEQPQPASLEWQYFRAVLRIETRARGAYVYRILLDDPLHPDDYCQLDELSRAADRLRSVRGELPLPRMDLAGPTPATPPPGSGPDLRVWISDPQKVEGLDFRPSTARGSGFQTLEGLDFRPSAPPHTPPCMPHSMPLGHGMPAEDSTESSTGVDDAALRDHAAACLGELGMGRAVISRVLAQHPDAALWAVRWSEWQAARKPKNPAGFVIAMVRAACAGAPEAREAPGIVLRRQAQASRAERQAERTASILAARPAAPKTPAVTVPPVAPDLAAPWDTLRGALRSARPMLAGLLDSSGVRPLRLDQEPDGPCLVIGAGGLAGSLNAKRREILGVVRGVDPSYPEIRFIDGRERPAVATAPTGQEGETDA